MIRWRKQRVARNIPVPCWFGQQTPGERARSWKTFRKEQLWDPRATFYRFFVEFHQELCQGCILYKSLGLKATEKLLGVSGHWNLCLRRERDPSTVVQVHDGSSKERWFERIERKESLLAKKVSPDASPKHTRISGN